MTSISDILPIGATDGTGTQLFQKRPPIEDTEYVPTNSSELASAAYTVALEMPDEHIAEFYKQLLEMSKHLKENFMNQDNVDHFNEARKYLKLALNEAPADDPKGSADGYAGGDKDRPWSSVIDTFGDDDKKTPEPDITPSWKDVEQTVKRTDGEGDSNVKRWAHAARNKYRLLLTAMAEDPDFEEFFDKLKREHAIQLVLILESGDIISPEDKIEMLSNIKHVQETELYKKYLNAILFQDKANAIKKTEMMIRRQLLAEYKKKQLKTIHPAIIEKMLDHEFWLGGLHDQWPQNKTWRKPEPATQTPGVDGTEDDDPFADDEPQVNSKVYNNLLKKTGLPRDKFQAQIEKVQSFVIRGKLASDIKKMVPALLRREMEKSHNKSLKDKGVIKKISKQMEDMYNQRLATKASYFDEKDKGLLKTMMGLGGEKKEKKTELEV